MFVQLKKGEQQVLLKNAIIKAGSQRKLAKLVNIPHQSIERYIKGKIMPEIRFYKLAKFIKIKDKENLIEKRLNNNWGQVKGGKLCVISKKKKGTFNRDMKILQDIQSIKLKKWHREMKLNSPESYYQMQYSRFKKIGGYKFLTLKGEKVRNKLEKDIADILFKYKIPYQYEALVHIGDKFFFPDFLIDNRIIVECTMWRGIEKAYKLKEKIEYLENKYKVFVVIPKALNRYYRLLDNNLIQGLDKFAPIAQTFLKK